MENLLKVGIHYIKSEDRTLDSIKDGSLTLVAKKPLTVQPSEIMKVSIGLMLHLDSDILMHLSTHSSLIERAAEIFPAYFILDSSCQKELFIPIRNSGRNPINIMPGNPVASAWFSNKTEIEIYDFSVEIQSAINPEKSVPQKRNSGVKFELKN